MSDDDEKKRLKKEAKKAKKEAKRKAEDGESEETSKKAKHETVAEQPVDEEAAAAAVKAEKKRLKKLKKEGKSSSDGATGEADRMKAIASSTAKSSSKKASTSSQPGGDVNLDLYNPSDATKNMTADAVAAYRKELDMVVLPEEDGETYNPITDFAEVWPTVAAMCPEIKKYVEDKKFSTPSPIQAQCWPPLLSGRDVIGIASTGSGKTMGFLVPALLKVAHFKKNRPETAGKVQILVIAPTRELAMQSDVVCREVAECGAKNGANVSRSVCIYGGVSKGEQKGALRKGVECVVATPGRLLDLVEEGSLDLSYVKYLVLDEADRMLDEGFEPAIRQIMSNCPTHAQGRQTVMFSATWPEEIRTLAAKYLKQDVVRVVVGGDELSANHRVTQIVECIDKWGRDRRLVEMLKEYHNSKNRCLIFVLYKREATTVLNYLTSQGYNAGAIHGDKAQADRTDALAKFKTGEVPLLIATDVAARGLDIPQVEYVLNYSFPLTVEDYVHRIGRTGRGGRTGISHTFFTDDDKGLAGALVGVLQQANQEVPKEIYKYPLITKKKKSATYGDFGPKADLIGKKATKITFD